MSEKIVSMSKKIQKKLEPENLDIFYLKNVTQTIS